ncbi:phosphoethanolamine transferase [Serratia sp. NPDC078593]|uniref:phosphoethanolamine transferase n=1 Tax=unclassified Serratia (in: enterobacteria) TaxID=2647522 RepID=UPI0037D01DDB
MKQHKNVIIFIAFIFWSILLNFSYGYAIRPGYVIALAILVMLAFRASRVAGSVIVFILSIISAAYLPTAVKYGPPSVNTVAAARYTSVSECLEFIRLIPVSSIILSLLIIVLGFTCIAVSGGISRLKSRAVSFMMLTAVVIVSFNPAISYMEGNALSYRAFNFSPVRFTTDIYKPYKLITEQEKMSAHLLATQDEWNPVDRGGKYDTYIMVVGESVRRDYMHAYGYGRNNTPFLSRANGIFFNNYYSPSFATVPSLTASFYPRSSEGIEYNNSIIRLAKKAGYKTFWLSNQGRFGTYDGPVADIGRQADVSYFIKSGDSNDHHYYPDHALMPSIKEALNDKSQKKLIVVHLIGSHPESCARTNGEYDEFYKSKDFSCYIQSIKNTDRMLEQITRDATDIGAKWSMLYFADHGLGQFNKGMDDAYMEHDDLNRQAFMPPFLITRYDDTQRNIVSEFRSGFDFVAIFSQWIRISDKHIKEHCDFLSNAPCENAIKVMDKDFKLIDVNTLGNDIAV